MKLLILGAIALVGTSLHAADYTLIQDLLGKYAITTSNNDPTVAGNGEIFADDNGVGYRLTPMPMATNPAPTVEFRSPKEGTTLTRTGNTLTQEYIANASTLSVKYELNDGYISITNRACDTLGCTDSAAELSKGKATGTSITLQDFITQMQGKYQIKSADGTVPAVGDDVGQVSSDTGLGILTFPYCPPGFHLCDIGERDLNLDGQEVFVNHLGTAHDVYTFLVPEGANLHHYAWEVNQQVVVFHDFNYKRVDGLVMSLDFIAAKK